MPAAAVVGNLSSPDRFLVWVIAATALGLRLEKCSRGVVVHEGARVVGEVVTLDVDSVGLEGADRSRHVHQGLVDVGTADAGIAAEGRFVDTDRWHDGSLFLKRRGQLA